MGEEWYRVRLYINNKLEGIYLSEAEIIEKYGSKIHEVGVKIDDSPLTPRLIMQLLGTECGRNILHPNLWVNSLMGEYNPGSDCSCIVHEESLGCYHCDYTGKDTPPSQWIITDVRYPNELQAIVDRGGITIKVERPEVDKILHSQQHISETSLDNSTFDYVINNNSSVEDLVEKVKQILIKENIL